MRCKLALLFTAVLLASSASPAAEPSLLSQQILSAPDYVLTDNFFTAPITGNRNNYTGEVGFSFQPQQDLLIGALGWGVNPNFNSGNLLASHTISLWDDNTTTLLTQVTVNNASPRDANDYAYELLSSPYSLSAGGQYVLTASVTSGDGDPWFNLGGTAGDSPMPLVEGTHTNSALADILGPRYQSGIGNFPSQGNNVDGTSYSAPTFFLVEPVLSPEPTSLVLMGLGIAGAAVWTWRRRRALG